MAIRVTIWNENYHEQVSDEVRAMHPDGLHGTLAKALAPDSELEVRCATLDMPECGLTEEVLAETDVLFWWGHCKHGDVPDAVVDRVQRHVLGGMGLVALHSAHESKIFQRLMGTSCGLRWHEIGEKERIFVLEPSHPVMQGVPDYFELGAEEMYGERFDIPAPEALLALAWYPSGEVFRAACTFTRGGKILYFQPGHETLPSYQNEHVQTILRNAAHWAARSSSVRVGSQFAPPLETI